jgi:outer membrane receptor protein involved in Fe transport
VGRRSLKNPRQILVIPVALACVAVSGSPGAEENPPDGAEEPSVITEIVVTGQRRQQSSLEYAGNIARLDGSEIRDISHQHIHELLNQVAGAWLVRGSGQEHLTAIRSPVLSGAGSCGGFLILEDGIPIRPSGFCNVNQLFELHTEQADSVEVIRGPGNALYGANALHGVINALMPVPGETSSPYLALEVGANDFWRVKATLPFDRQANWHGSVVYADDGGFRDDSPHNQGKLHLKHSGQFMGGDFTLALTATHLDQETAGFINGFEAYRDAVTSRMNFNPDAFRKAESRRLYAIWNRRLENFEVDIRPFVRYSDMDFLHHFAPGTPLEKNGQTSAGIISALSFAADRHRLVTGVDLEWADTFLEQSQDKPAEGSPFLVETRPVGKHYDYQVDQWAIAPYVQAEFFVNERWTVGIGARYEYIRYDYDNRMIAGNTRDDGSECGFGGCLYSRPEDRSDSYSNFAPKFSVHFRIDPGTALYASLGRGFRAPQMTELYRLQRGQLVSDLDSERLDSLEIGWRAERERWRADLAAYVMRKRDSVFRDAQGFNVSGARTRHHGIEASLFYRFAPAWSFALDGTWARHEYDFTFVPDGGEQFIAGLDVVSAPRWLGSARLRFHPAGRADFELQWVHQAKYFLESQNRFTYGGHDLLNLRTALDVGERTRLVLRLNNLTDRRYADRARYAFGNYQYFPGRGRELFVEIRYAPEG